tara:strand:+ start:345 stop:743 length:399 start_codon:yes stop_codon:yes gene_type:complete
MSVGYSPKLPLKESESGATFGLNERLQESVKQNVKMLILTAPGERIMDVNFGVGLRRFFFRPMNETTFELIATNIRDQISRYMPFLDFSGIQIATNENDQSLALNQIRLKVFYTIPSIGESDSVDFIEFTAT